MTEYIDKELLIETINQSPCENGSQRAAQLLHYILNAPPADVAPVKHCKWACIDESAGVYNCSYCGDDFFILEGTPDDNIINYCPQCGAKLSKE